MSPNKHLTLHKVPISKDKLARFLLTHGVWNICEIWVICLFRFQQVFFNFLPDSHCIQNVQNIALSWLGFLQMTDSYIPDYKAQLITIRLVFFCSKFRKIIFFCRYVPVGFRKSYIVPIPKPKDCRSKSMKYDDLEV